METNVTYPFCYPLRINGRLVSEIEGTCTLTVKNRGDHLYVLDATDIEFPYIDADPENLIIKHGTCTAESRAMNDAEKALAWGLNAAINYWLVDGDGSAAALDAVADDVREGLKATASEARHAFMAAE